MNFSPVITQSVLLKQPDEVTCGPTCVAMLLQGVKRETPYVDPMALWKAIDAKRETGTRDIEMARALDVCDLLSRQSFDPDIDLIRDHLSVGHKVLVRGLVDGEKHWVLLDSAAITASGAVIFEVLDPWSGRHVYSSDQLHDIMSPRGFEHWIVDPRIDPSLYPEIHELTLEEFTTTARARIVNKFGKTEVQYIEAAKKALDQIPVDLKQKLRFQHANVDFYRSHSANRPLHSWDLLAVRRDDGARLGVIHLGTTYVSPEARGSGYGAALVRAAFSDRIRRYLYPTHYSAAGLASRVAAHRDAVMDAIKQGVQVRREVIDSNPKLQGQVLRRAAETAHGSESRAKTSMALH